MKKALTMLKARSTVQLFHETRVTKKKRLVKKFLKLAVLRQMPLFQKEKTIITTTTVEKTTMVMLIATVHPF